MRLKSALRRGVAAAVIAGIVVSSGIPAYAARWNIADGDITVEAGDEGTNRVTPVSYTHLRAHETDSYLVCRLLLEKKKTMQNFIFSALGSELKS